MPFQPPRGLKQAMRAGDAKFGMLLGSSSVQIAELAAFAGIDYLIVDLEHGDAVEAASAAEMIRAADAVGTPVIVRVPRNAPDIAAAVLDHGAIGICVPHVRTREDAEQAAANARYAPDGVRAMSNLVRAARFSFENWDEYWGTANAEVIVMVIIEDREGMSNIDEIASVPGVDVVWIGTGDLSQDAGVPGDLAHPDMVAATARGLEAARAHGKISFAPLVQPLAAGVEARRGEIEGALDAGVRMMAWMDALIFGGATADVLAVGRSAASAAAAAS
jgi:4-hydroxy-2-oxoheptanedioate aldolase